MSLEPKLFDASSDQLLPLGIHQQSYALLCTLLLQLHSPPLPPPFLSRTKSL